MDFSKISSYKNICKHLKNVIQEVQEENMNNVPSGMSPEVWAVAKFLQAIVNWFGYVANLINDNGWWMLVVGIALGFALAVWLRNRPRKVAATAAAPKKETQSSLLGD